jgi:hypothetical protein
MLTRTVLILAVLTSSAQAQRAITAQEYEAEILKTQREIEDIPKEISLKIGVAVAVMVAFPEEVPFWIECLHKGYDATEAVQLKRKWDIYQYDVNTYLTQEWRGLQQHPMAYAAFQKDPRVKSYAQLRAELKQQGIRMGRPQRACHAKPPPKQGNGNLGNAPPPPQRGICGVTLRC